MSKPMHISAARGSGVTPPPRVVAIVPVFNRRAATLGCVVGLKAQSYRPLSIVVVDGGSSDGTPEAVRSEHPDVCVYAERAGLWWTDAVALGVSRVLPDLGTEDFIFLVNNDTILSPDTVAGLVATSRRHSGAVVAATVREVSGRPIAAGARMVWGVELSQAVGHEDADLAAGGVIPVDVVFGRATIVPARAFHEVGNFDGRRFPQYYGDSDFFLRVSRAGIPVLIDCETPVRCREDEDSTGVHFTDAGAITLRRAWEMATSRKSSLNLAYGVRFVWRYAPGPQRLLCAAALVRRNLTYILNRYLRRYERVYRLLRARPLFLSYAELRRHGFDPAVMLAKREIEHTEFPHLYHLSVSRSRMLLEWNRFGSLVRRNYNPCVYLRVRDFVRRQRALDWRRKGAVKLPAERKHRLMEPFPR